MIAQWLIQILSRADPAGWGGGVKAEERARASAVAKQPSRSGTCWARAAMVEYLRPADGAGARTAIES
jgi:hypothetical protein